MLRTLRRVLAATGCSLALGLAAPADAREDLPAPQPEAGAPPSTAPPPGGPHGPHGGGPHGRFGPEGGAHRLERLVERLDLDEATLKSVYDVIDASRVRQRAVRRELREAHAHMRALLAAEAPDEAAVFAQLDTIGQHRTSLEKERLGTLLRVRALLPETARAALLEGMQKRGRPHRGRWMRERGGPS